MQLNQLVDACGTRRQQTAHYAKIDAINDELDAVLGLVPVKFDLVHVTYR